MRFDNYPEWVDVAEYADGININKYFISHPEMILGDMVLKSSRYGFETACKLRDGMDLQTELHKAVMNLSAHISPNNEHTEIELYNSDVDLRNVRNLTYIEQDGKLYFYKNGSLTIPDDLNSVKEERIKGLNQIRKATRKVIDIQTFGCTDEELKAEQYKLNKKYDEYTKKYGYIHSRGNKQAFAADADMPLLSLENVDEDGNITKADMFSKQTIRPYIPVETADNAIDGLKISLSEKGKVDIKYISMLTHQSKDNVVRELDGLVYKNPVRENIDDVYVGYETADEYLSGNVLEKLETAISLNKDGKYDKNIEALTPVQPEPLTAADIPWKIGLSWISVEDYQKFMYDTLNTRIYLRESSFSSSANTINIRYNNYTNTWTVYNKQSDNGNLKVTTEFGTSRKNAYEIMEDSLNLQNCVVRDRHDDGERVWYTVNSEETAKAQEKQAVLRERFAEWVLANPEIRDKYVKYYNRTYNNTRLRQYDGSHLIFPGMSPAIQLREHQLNAVARVLYSDTNALLAHTVGAGKTYEIATSCMELKRLGLAKKSMIVVPNHLTEQWGSEFMQLYPGANILVATKKDFVKDKRQEFFSKIATGDWDAVIIGHSQFEKIPISNERLANEISQEIEKITIAIEEIENSEGRRFSVKQLESKKKNLKAKYEDLTAQEVKDDIFCFEQLGVDYMFVDEAHNFKNCIINTKLSNVAGLSTTSSNKSMDMLWKCKYLSEIQNGRGVVFATGTPISNSITEMYVMQRYLDNGLLEQKGFGFFDNWVAMFGNVTTGLELAPEGTGYRMKNRLSKFDNLPELMKMFSHFADVQTSDMLKLPVPKHTMHNVALEPDDFTKNIMMTFVERAKVIRDKKVEPEVDNMLKITNEARKLALDPKLISADAPMSRKLEACADTVYGIYKNTRETKGTQLVFCDLGTPKDGTDINDTAYGRLINTLIEKGINRNEIAVIHSAKTDVQKAEMFAKVRSGHYRVLIGSTDKMGAGTNCQKRLVALHHLDCPWRSSDIEQREGRILRQGNMNEHVDIYRYVVKNTFDAYLWQIVENKQRFINQVMRGDIGVRSCEDADETRGNSNTLYQKGHSLNITRSKNLWYRFSTGTGGNVIDFAMEQNGWNFQEAVRALCGEDIQKSIPKRNKSNVTEKVTKTPMILPKANQNARRVFAYLVKTRHIAPGIVSQLMREKKIYENEFHSCVFVGYDKSGKAGYASIRSTNTNGKVYKGDVENSDKQYGFTINGKSDTVHVFEAPIDAMSHASIMKMSGWDWQEDWRIALGGFSDLALEEFLKNHSEIKNIYFATDNDEQGKKILVNECDENGEITKIGYMQKYYEKGYEVFREEPTHKDFNEDLCALCVENAVEEEICR